MVSFFVGCLGTHNWAFISGESETCSKSYLAAFFLSLATNMLATSLIATKAWQVAQLFNNMHVLTIH